ncbi:hypothetical protein BS333_02945 [Vibrio azureus]|nr:hypothetical protein BS333_02945 [Vibrio azureus]
MTEFKLRFVFCTERRGERDTRIRIAVRIAGQARIKEDNGTGMVSIRIAGQAWRIMGQTRLE